MPISPAQFRAARDLSDLSDEQLAQQSGVSMRAILAFQAGEAIPSQKDASDQDRFLSVRWYATRSLRQRGPLFY